MILGLERALAASGQPGLPELREALSEALDAPEGSAAWVGEQSLKARVFRIRFSVNGAGSSVVAKRLEPPEARRCEQALRRWLPEAGLASAAPRLLAVSRAAGSCVWHVYEDLGEDTLERRDDGERVTAAVRLIARLHARFASHPLLSECRAAGSDYGIAFYSGNVRDAIGALESLRDSDAIRTAEERALRDRLLARLERLLAEEPGRGRVLAEAGGAETLLHGDPWTSNAFVARTERGLEARFVDWDRAGVGPVSYDLSAFLLRFPRARRGAILDLYARSLAEEGGRPPERGALESLFETAELARYANRVIWPARALAAEHAAWGLPELAEVERWFEAWEPVLEHPTAARAHETQRSRRAAGREPPGATRRLIVNADDLGACPGVNRGILEGHRSGIVTSASLMVDAPAALEAAGACREAPGLSVGLHVDLGRAGAEASAGEIRDALERQAARFLELVGAPPTHLDSHRNVHRDARLLPVFLELARRWGVPLRWHSGVSVVPDFYGQWNGESHPEQVGVASLLRMLASRARQGVTELICHPGRADPTLDSSYSAERELELETLCDPEIRRALAALDITLVGFGELGSPAPE